MPDQPSSRPPLNRGNTVPVYFKKDPQSSSQDSSKSSQADEVKAFADAMSLMSLSDRSKTQSRPPLEHTRSTRDLQSTPVSPHWSSSMQRWNSSSSTHPPTPPLSNSPGSAESSSQHNDSSFSSSSTRMSRAPSIDQPITFISEAAHNSYVRSIKSPTPQPAKMRIEATPAEYILSAPLGPGFDSSCITVSQRKGNVLGVVADRWDSEKDCRYEWQVQFDRDADMSSIKANYTNNGILILTVRRIPLPRYLR